MAELINLMHEMGATWCKPITWMKINAGYIDAELDTVAKSGGSPLDILDFSAGIYGYCNDFIGEEVRLYSAVRTFENDMSAKSMGEAVDALHKMRHVFDQWMEELNRIRGRREHQKGTPAHMLLEGCGSEIVNSHYELIVSIDKVEASLATEMQSWMQSKAGVSSNETVAEAAIKDGKFGCEVCRNLAVDNIEMADMPFHRLAEIYDSSHFAIWIDECIHCHQFYLETFNETSYMFGEEEMWSTWKPITRREGETIKHIAVSSGRNEYSITQQIGVITQGRSELMRDNNKRVYWH